MTTTFSVAEATVREIADSVAKGELTPADVFESVVARIEATESKIQAWSQLDLEVAQTQAATLTAEARAGKLRGPLHGVPVAIKEEFYMEGFPTLFKGPDAEPETEDATIVARLRAAGALIVGKTTMPVGGKNPPTRNPWNLAHTAGGSSSGSGATVGARVVPIAVGEQTGGSNLRPAAYNGVEGIKPTYGRISRFGCYPFTWSRDTAGLIGVDMTDMALVLSVVCGFDPKDPTSLHEPPPSADLKMAEFAPPKIGVVRNFFPERTEPAMQEAIEKSAAKLAAGGATVEDVMLPAEFSLAWTAGAMSGAEGAALHSERRAGVKPANATEIGQRAVELIPATYFVQGRRIRTWLQGIMQDFFASQGYSALLMAVAPGAAPFGLESTGDASLLSPWTWLGLPAITLNGGLSPEGLPLGLQFVGPYLSDWEMLRLGVWGEGVLGKLHAPAI